MAAPSRNDHAGLVYLLDSAGRTLEQLEHRVEDLTTQVAALTHERDELRARLAQVLATYGVPPLEDPGPENGRHDDQPPGDSAP